MDKLENDKQPRKTIILNVHKGMCCNNIFDSINKHGDDIDCLEFLLRKKRYSANIKNGDKVSPLYVAIDLGYINSVILLLNHGASANDNCSILDKQSNIIRYNNYYIVAIQNNRMDCIDILYNYGAPLYPNDLEFCSNEEMFNTLIKYTSIDNFNLGYYIQNDDELMVRVLLKNKINVTKDAFKKALENLKYLKIFVEYSIDFNIFDTNTILPLLHNAILMRNKDQLKILLTSNLDINKQNKSKETALFKATYSDDEEYIYMLIDKGIDQSKVNINGRTAYQYAISCSQKIIDDYNLLLQTKEPSIEDECPRSEE